MSTTQSPAAQSETAIARAAHPQRRLIFFICALALSMASIDGTIVATALPRIGVALHSRLNWLGWSITIYQLGQIIATLPIAGKIGDQFGRKKIFVICMIVFTVSSLACGLSTSIYMLIPLRFLQGLGGGGFMPSASGIVAEEYGPDRDRALGLFSSIQPIGGIAGPIFGGLITQFWSWRGIFFFNVPLGVALFILTVRVIPRSIPRPAPRFDFTGLALLASTILTGMLAVTLLGQPSMAPTDTRVIVPAIAAVLLGWGFMRHAHREPDPVIPLMLLRGKGFSVMNLLNVLYGGAVFGFGALLPLYAEKRYHISISSSGTVLSSRSIGMIVVAVLATMMLRRTGYRLPMTIGFLTIAVGFVMLSIAPLGLPPYWWLALFALVTGIGMGFSAPATNNAAFQLAPDHVAAISGLRAMFRTMGGILLISVTTAVLARSADPGLAQAHLLLVQAAALVVMTGLVYVVPDHRGGW